MFRHDLNFIRIIVYDFDGVMTENRIYVDQEGRQMMQVNRADGLAVAEFSKLGIKQFRWHTASAFFVIRTKSNTEFKRRYSRPVEMNNGVRCDQTVVLTGLNNSVAYPKTLRRIHYFDSETEKHLIF